jgi:hypothetical protein
MSARIAPEGATPRRPRRRTLLASLLVALVLAGAGGWLVLRPGSDAGPTAAAAMETPLPPAGSYGESVLDPSTTAEPTDVPEVVLADVPGLPEALPPVALGGSTTYSDGVAARLVDVKAVTAAARLPGETAGPALAVIVELTNTTAEGVSLDTVAVNLYVGTEGVRAARVQADSGAPFSGTLAAGASAQAIYAFSVPEDQRNAVTVTVGHSPEAGTAVFSGAVA